MENGTAIESGGIEISLDQNLELRNNTIQTLNAPANERGDGEAITSQNSNIPDVLDAGQATGVGPTSVTDAQALWGPITLSRLPKYPEMIAILTGTAAGQWRKIESINIKTKTVTVDRPWNPDPEVGSRYSIFVWTLSKANIEHNTLIDNPNGIVIWNGCYQCTFQHNTLVNSRGIILRAADETNFASKYPEVRRLHDLVLSSAILDNVVSNTSGLRPAYIALDVEAFAPDSYRGLGMMDIELANNAIHLNPADPDKNYDPRHNQISQEGFFPCFLFGPAAVRDPSSTIFQNIHFSGNSQTMAVHYSQNFLRYTTQACTTAPPNPGAPKTEIVQ
jgi:parallel beta-helix repeat protein